MSTFQLGKLKETRLKTAKIYHSILADIVDETIDLSTLQSIVLDMGLEKYMEMDLMKMVKTNYLHTKNKSEVDSLMNVYSIHEYKFKKI